MKKLIIFMTLFGLFILASCDKEPISDTTPSSNQTTESNQQTNETSESKEEDTTTSTEDNPSESTLPDYDDGGEWKGTIF